MHLSISFRIASLALGQSYNWQSYDYLCNGPCGDRTWVANSRVQHPNHWAIKAPEWPSRLCLAGLLHYSPLFEIRAPWLGPLSTKAWSFQSQANPGYCCHQCNGPCGDRTWVANSRVQRPNHWAIKVSEWPSRLHLAGSLHLKASEGTLSTVECHYDTMQYNTAMGCLLWVFWRKLSML